MEEFLVKVHYGEREVEFHEEGTDGQFILEEIISTAKKSGGWLYVSEDAKNIVVNLNSIHSIEVIGIAEQKRMDNEANELQLKTLKSLNS